MTSIDERCRKCGIPRKAYDLIIEPSPWYRSKNDPTQGNCWHEWESQSILTKLEVNK